MVARASYPRAGPVRLSGSREQDARATLRLKRLLLLFVSFVCFVVIFPGRQQARQSRRNRPRRLSTCTMPQVSPKKRVNIASTHHHGASRGAKGFTKSSTQR